MDTKNKGFNSKLVHGGGYKDQLLSAVTPIYQTSTFAFHNADHGAQCFAGESDGYIYTRLGNPTIIDLEKTVAELENGFGGIATSSGMAAVNTVYLGILESGSHMIGHEALYGPSRAIMESLYPKFNVESTFVDATKLENVKNAIRPNTRLIFLETPANPTIGITDIKAVSEIAKEVGAVVCVDNTFCSPYLQNPLDLGADIVMHSLTKYLGGHSDVVMGALVCKDAVLAERLYFIQNSSGAVCGPQDSFLVLRGIKTLHLRMQRHCENGKVIANYLKSHPKVAGVFWPGFEDHPNHEIAKKQMCDFGGMISFTLKGDLQEEAYKVMSSFRVFTLAESLGGVESLICHPASMTHAAIPKEQRQKSGVLDSMIRLSVGVEDISDLLEDIEFALNQI